MNVNFPALLQYKNEQVVTHFCHFHPAFSLSEAQQLFEDLLAWMGLSWQRTLLGKKTYLFGPLLIMDEMWHTFILHTQDYYHFSMTYFGEYVHHHVEPIGFEHVLEEDELTDFLQDCFNYLDAAWVERRFSGALA
ncbi:hypothetical protein [Legionella maioricensis]|uniref:Uncharacterized protein n=1 Tax=Legionella maioricensis TaxID=2896528 RepID=A0A9X2IBU8_9GAMM|nr:hypothetical protein [Legionella maioricensis]MCL9684785.1 hypothetical protein [Legionella maioricensis]MCL9687813.1 hypothetical protein [Legionella maioricensis]